MNARTLLIAIMPLTFLTSLFAGEKAGVDLSTPERAVHSLEAAWRANDIEKAIRCKDFHGEAEQILRDKPAEVRTAEIIAQTAEVLEMGYRAEIKKSGFPDMKGVTSQFIERRELSPGLVVLTEEFRFADGRTQTEKVHVRRTKDGWKVTSAP